MDSVWTLDSPYFPCHQFTNSEGPVFADTTWNHLGLCVCVLIPFKRIFGFQNQTGDDLTGWVAVGRFSVIWHVAHLLWGVLYFQNSPAVQNWYPQFLHIVEGCLCLHFLEQDMKRQSWNFCVCICLNVLLRQSDSSNLSRDNGKINKRNFIILN